MEALKLKPHLAGIGGIGMSALAHLLCDRFGPHSLTGSDAHPEHCIELLQRGLHLQPSEMALSPASTHLVHSSAITATHPLRQQALAHALPQWHRSDLLAHLMGEQSPLLVTGTHGKTTTSALLAWTLYHAQWDPSFALGGRLQGAGSHPQIPYHGRSGKGLYFVAEADESDGSFLRYPIHGAILTNIEREHLDHYGTMEHLVQAFRRFITRVPPQRCIWCAEDLGLRQLHPHGWSYGRSPDAHWRLVESTQIGWELRCKVREPDGALFSFTLPLVGEHNALNATAVWALLRRLGMPPQWIAEGFAAFPGVQRRCEQLLMPPGTLLHDYAHHPTELRVTLAALRSAQPARRLVAIFQPHRFTRTLDHMAAFAAAFYDADKVLLTDVYAASERPIAQACSQSLLRQLRQFHPDADYVPYTQLVDRALSEALQPEAPTLVFFGAGNIQLSAAECAARMRALGPEQAPSGSLILGT